MKHLLFNQEPIDVPYVILQNEKLVYSSNAVNSIHVVITFEGVESSKDYEDCYTNIQATFSPKIYPKEYDYKSQLEVTNSTVSFGEYVGNINEDSNIVNLYCKMADMRYNQNQLPIIIEYDVENL